MIPYEELAAALERYRIRQDAPQAQVQEESHPSLAAESYSDESTVMSATPGESAPNELASDDVISDVDFAEDAESGSDSGNLPN